MTPQDFMRRAIRCAEAGMRGGRGGPFGCVIVQDGQVVAEGENRVTSTNDPTERRSPLRTNALSRLPVYEPVPA